MAGLRGKDDTGPDLEEILDEIHNKMERLRVLYEQYFMGIERMEPHTARKEVTRKLLELTQMNIRNTAIRYRFNALNQKFSSYTAYWSRTQRAIENGTYVRNVAKVGRDALRKGQEIPAEILHAMPARMREKILKEREALLARAAKEAERAGEKAGRPAESAPAADAPPAPRPAAKPGLGGAWDLSLDDVDDMFNNITSSPKATPPVAPARAATPPPAAAPPPRPAASTPATPSRPVAAAPARPGNLPPGVDEASARDLYKRYVQAKKLMGEDVSALKYEHIVNTLNKQAPSIMEKHKASGVSFDVVIKDDKVLLKATPKK